MLNATTLLLVFQLAGEIIVLLFTLPVPGPAIGMALLFATLAWGGGPPVALRKRAQNLLQHLSLLFVPAVLVMLTGILGAVGARSLYALLKIDDHAVRGFAIGVASHGIGTARAFQVSEQAGARRPGHGPQWPADRCAAAVAVPAADARVGLNPQQVGAGEATILGVADSGRCISPRSPGAPGAAD